MRRRRPTLTLFLLGALALAQVGSANHGTPLSRRRTARKVEGRQLGADLGFDITGGTVSGDSLLSPILDSIFGGGTSSSPSAGTTSSFTTSNSASSDSSISTESSITTSTTSLAESSSAVVSSDSATTTTITTTTTTSSSLSSSSSPSTSSAAVESTSTSTTESSSIPSTTASSTTVEVSLGTSIADTTSSSVITSSEATSSIQAVTTAVDTEPETSSTSVSTSSSPILPGASISTSSVSLDPSSLTSTSSVSTPTVVSTTSIAASSVVDTPSSSSDVPSSSTPSLSPSPTPSEDTLTTVSASLASPAPTSSSASLTFPVPTASVSDGSSSSSDSFSSFDSVTSSSSISIEPAASSSASESTSTPLTSSVTTGSPYVTTRPSPTDSSTRPSDSLSSSTSDVSMSAGDSSSTITPSIAAGSSSSSSIAPSVSAESTSTVSGLEAANATTSARPSSAISASGSVFNTQTLVNVSSVPTASGSGVKTFTDDSTSSSTASFSTSSSTASFSTTSTDDAYTPSATGLIVATTRTPDSSSGVSTSTTPTRTTGSSSSSVSATVAQIPSSIPTLIVPANSAVNQPDAGTGSDKDPLKDDTLIAILLNAQQFPWTFVVNSSDATSQLLNTFPSLISSALGISASSVQTYGLMVYQPDSWDGTETSLLTQYMAYIPEGQFDTLNAYLKTSNSPLYTQNGLEGQLAAQINTAFPLAASSGPTSSASDTAASGSSSTTRTRDIIIGVCVGIGGLLWVGLVYWIYKRVKRSNERAVHNRLSEHMSSMPGYGGPDRRVSRAPSIAASEVDDRPSSFYASPLDNDRFRGDYPRSSENPFGDGHESPTTYGPSVFGTSWFAQPKPNATTSRMSQNPFEEMVTRSFLTTSGSNGNLGSGLPQRRSTAGRRVEVQKGMISQPTLQTNSLEFREY